MSLVDLNAAFIFEEELEIHELGKFAGAIKLDQDVSSVAAKSLRHETCPHQLDSLPAHVATAPTWAT